MVYFCKDKLNTSIQFKKGPTMGPLVGYMILVLFQVGDGNK
jgi:hypothetical protein